MVKEAGKPHNNYLFEAWEAMASGQLKDHPALRLIIKESWRRCLSYGVDPYNPKIEILSSQELAERLEKNRSILEAARPFMESLYRLVAGSGFVVTLCDKDGYLLDILGDPEVLDDARHIALTRGVNWAERCTGTTAIGVCLATEQPVQVWGAEHYWIGCHSWTCSAAPIYEPGGRLVAVLNMSGSYQRVHPHTLGMVVAAADAITYQLRAREASRQLEINNRFLLAVLESISDGLISIDREGRSIHINAVAARLLGFEPEKIIGTLLPAEVSERLRLHDVLLRGLQYTDHEITLELPHRRVHVAATIRPIIDGHSIIGAVATLREMVSVRRLVHRMIGARAHFTFENIIGTSEAIRKAIQLARTAAASSSNVLLLGESGTGKELFAQAIHNASERRHGPFVAINCAAVPRELVGSELFGYSEGAFTGAKPQGAPGKFELADGGTIFLDEIADMPWEQQAALLRVLEERQVTRIGGNRVVPVNVRVIAATNRDLLAEVRAGRFRHDLYYRINVLCIRIPPLRERKEDIRLLAEYFLQRFNREFGTSAFLTPEAYELLESYHWPGNVRELQNVLQQAILLAGGGKIGPGELPLPTAEGHSHAVKTEKEPLPLKDVEKESIKRVLHLCGGNVSKAARLLGIGRSTLYRKLKKWGFTA